MKLTKKDKEFLRILGYSEETDLRQIEEAMTKTVYELNGKEKISCDEAVKLLGRETFLNGLSRSAFHWSAVRDTQDGENTVSFDSSKLFQ